MFEIILDLKVGDCMKIQNKPKKKVGGEGREEGMEGKKKGKNRTIAGYVQGTSERII